ncbi:MAG: hypothetical protein ACRDAI_01215 [Candidatus Rhabdochlamydia sp.]
MNKEFHREFIATWAPRELWLHKEKRTLEDNPTPPISTFDSSTSSAKIEQKVLITNLPVRRLYEFSSSK